MSTGHPARKLTATLAVAMALAAVANAATRQVGDLVRVNDRPLQALDGIDTEYGVVTTPGGDRLRTIVTKPTGSTGRLPAIAFVHWLSCDSVDFDSDAMDGWSQMLKRLITTSGFVVQRMDKSGVGDSTGTPCDQLDYETELAQHRAALEALMARPDVDPARIVIFGASMGSNYAPLLAASHPVAGVIIWGGGAATWYERTLLFERHSLELGGADPATISPEMTARAAFLDRYLIRGELPAAIAHDDPVLGGVWSRMVEASGVLHYGRPLAFDQQAQRQNWPAAWAKVKAPVLVLYGEYDWFESPESARAVADIVNRGRPGTADFMLVPSTNHHFTRYPSRAAAYEERGGIVNAAEPVDEIVRWLRGRGISK